MRSPAIASARVVGSNGSNVRTTPFSRIMAATVDDEGSSDARARHRQRDRPRDRETRSYLAALEPLGYRVRLRGAGDARVPRRRSRTRLRNRAAGANRRRARSVRVRQSRARGRVLRRRYGEQGYRRRAPVSARSTTRTTTPRSSSTRTAITSRPSVTNRSSPWAATHAAPPPRARRYVAGRMFWLTRKTLSGSYSALTRVRRS